MFGLYRDMTEDDAVVISSNGQLTLTLVSKDHEGEWRCQATNSLGNGEAKTKLTVTSVKGNTHTHTHPPTHTHPHTPTHTHPPTHTHTYYTCPVLSCLSTTWLRSHGLPKGMYKNSKSRATMLLGHTWYTDSGHATAT